MRSGAVSWIRSQTKSNNLIEGVLTAWNVNGVSNITRQRQQSQKDKVQTYEMLQGTEVMSVPLMN